jgi:cyclic pyranopterin phosphate synthase
MEALTATAVSLLTVWDMVKQYEKDAEGQYPSTVIENIRVVKKIKKNL